MREGGRPPRAVFGIWLVCSVLLVAAVVLGRGISGSLGDGGLSIALGYAGGAVLAALADTLMPEAFEHGRPVNALATTAGFFLSFMLAT